VRQRPTRRFSSTDRSSRPSSQHRANPSVPPSVRTIRRAASAGPASRASVRAPTERRRGRPGSRASGPQARAARRDAFSVFFSQSALARLTAHPWPGNHRELKLLATNALVFSLVQQLDSDAGPEKSRAERAPAVLAVSDQLVDQLLGKRAAPQHPVAVISSKAGGGERRVEVSLKPAQSFAEISADVERQYLMALFHAHGGDLDRMAAELFGPGSSRRKVHLRMNQLGLRLRNLRGTSA